MQLGSTQPRTKRNGRLRFSLALLLIVVTVCAVAVHFYQRHKERTLVYNWADKTLIASPSLLSPALEFADWYTPLPVATPCPDEKISRDHQLRLLIRHIHGLETDHQQAVLQIIAQQFGSESREVFTSLLSKSSNEPTRVNLLRLIALHRRVEDVPLFESLLDSPEPAIRAAAIESIGWVHRPNLNSLPNDLHTKPQLTFLEPEKSGLRVELTSFRPKGEFSDLKNIPTVKVDDAVRHRILNAAVNDKSERVRTAAKMALFVWPKNNRFRFAEWGVWINDGGELQWLKSIADEIPPFAHRIPDTVSSLEENRLNRITLIDKPVVHVTVDRPTVFSVSAMISKGRVWFAYPKPDDFQLGVATYGDKHALSELDSSEEGALDVLRGGYNWVTPLPPYRTGPISGGLSANNRLDSIGVRWNQVLAMPTKPAGWSSAAITAPNNQWWSDLRDVKCSWVENQGEQEKFLYYDGPTNKELPIHVSLQDEQLTILHHNYGPKDISRHTEAEKRQALAFIDFQRDRCKRNWLFVSVKSGEVSGIGFESNLAGDEIKLVDAGQLNLFGDQVLDQFVKFAMQEGLNVEEATGMARCWRKSFFETNGQRILCFLNRQDYDSFCPLEVKPNPTELARCGVVFTEFQPNETRDDPEVIQALRESSAAKYQLNSNGLVRAVELDLQQKEKLTNILGSLKKLTSLTRIKLAAAPGMKVEVDVEMLAVCSKVQTLEDLDIPNGDQFFVESHLFPQLKKLTLHSGSVTVSKDFVDQLKELKSLKVFRVESHWGPHPISRFDIPSAGIEKQFPNCKFIWK